MNLPGASATTRLAEAAVLRKAGNPEAARYILVRLADEFPNDVNVQVQTAFVHDQLGLEAAAVGFYECAVGLGLAGVAAAADVYLGLGSSYRVLGRYQDAYTLLEKACGLFPENRALSAFLAMAAFNLGKHEEAMRLLLTVISQVEGDESLTPYARAIRFYTETLGEIWE